MNKRHGHTPPCADKYYCIPNHLLALVISKQFGDISREIENRRKAWVKDYLGEEAAKNYQFGDITKKALSQFTGKDDYQFGDATKKILGDLFGKKK